MTAHDTLAWTSPAPSKITAHDIQRRILERGTLVPARDGKERLEEDSLPPSDMQSQLLLSTQKRINSNGFSSDLL